jgi:membrane-associated protease RseP (regulator of RpoE activity)
LTPLPDSQASAERAPDTVWTTPAFYTDDHARFVAATTRRRRGRDRLWLHVGLFLLTVVTTTLAGIDHYVAFLGNFSVPSITLSLFWHGLAYSATILGILGAHEMGHYVACRYYGVDASLPFFIPVPIFLTGTFGAVIRIRQPILHKKALFDIGIAGPIAGFLVSVPALLLGLHWSTIAAPPAGPLPPNVVMLSLGEPLLFKAASWLVWGHLSESLSLNMHPIAFAAWFGLFATAFNLFPIGQLDGGHIAYAAFGRRATWITFTGVGVLLGLTLVSSSWWLMSAIIVVMLFIVGPHHPPVLDEDDPLSPARRWLAVFALVMFVVCFTPAPIQPMDLLGR